MLSRPVFRVLFLALLLAATASSPRMRAQRQPSWDERFRALPDALKDLAAGRHFGKMVLAF